ncbi:putative PGG domain-containing protein [Helianthus anomalus]
MMLFIYVCALQEVKDIVPPPCREVKNAAGETPLELFTKNHKKLVSDGLKSINDTINISTVVAALVCTIAFSVVYSIPGGFDQNNGYPMHRRHNYFIAFVALDILSFIFSTGSIVNFLSIILSRHHQTMNLLYFRWSFGLIFLTYSILCITIAFILSFFIFYLKSSWKYILYVVAYLLITLYLGVFKSFSRDVFQLKDPSVLMYPEL